MAARPPLFLLCCALLAMTGAPRLGAQTAWYSASAERYCADLISLFDLYSLPQRPSPEAVAGRLRAAAAAAPQLFDTTGILPYNCIGDASIAERLQRHPLFEALHIPPDVLRAYPGICLLILIGPGLPTIPEKQAQLNLLPALEAPSRRVLEETLIRAFVQAGSAGKQHAGADAEWQPGAVEQAPVFGADVQTGLTGAWVAAGQGSYRGASTSTEGHTAAAICRLSPGAIDTLRGLLPSTPVGSAGQTAGDIAQEHAGYLRDYAALFLRGARLHGLPSIEPGTAPYHQHVFYRAALYFETLGDYGTLLQYASIPAEQLAAGDSATAAWWKRRRLLLRRLALMQLGRFDELMRTTEEVRIAGLLRFEGLTYLTTELLYFTHVELLGGPSADSGLARHARWLDGYFRANKAWLAANFGPRPHGTDRMYAEYAARFSRFPEVASIGKEVSHMLDSQLAAGAVPFQSEWYRLLNRSFDTLFPVLQPEALWTAPGPQAAYLRPDQEGNRLEWLTYYTMRRLSDRPGTAAGCAALLRANAGICAGSDAYCHTYWERPILRGLEAAAYRTAATRAAPPMLTLFKVPDTVATASVKVSGVVTGGGAIAVFLNGTALPLNGRAFERVTALVPGRNLLRILARAPGGAEEEHRVEVFCRLPADSFLTRKDYALLIAVDSYQHWPRLQNPTADADAVGSLLRSSYGFEVEILRNPTKKDLQAKLRTLLSRPYGPYDQQLVLFSGHGAFDTLVEQGYLVLADTKGEADDPDHETYLDLSALKTTLSGRGACRHLLLMLDACYAGTIDRVVAASAVRGASVESAGPPSGRETGQRMRTAMKYKSRKYITSAGKVPVSDGRPGENSPFVQALLHYLREGADAGELRSFDDLSVFLRKAATAGVEATGSDHDYAQCGALADEERGSSFFFLPVGQKGD